MKKIIILLFLGGLAYFLWKVPFLSVKPKQYAVKDNEVIKVESTQAKKETAAEVITKKESVLVNDPFARWAVLENYAAGYKLTYPDGFKIDYTATNITVTPPSGGGKVMMAINKGSFGVTVDNSGANSDQTKLLNAAADLVRNSFEFVSGPGYDASGTKQRFGK